MGKGKRKKKRKEKKRKGKGKEKKKNCQKKVFIKNEVTVHTENKKQYLTNIP